jgi:hypothetical protein
VCSSDLSSAPYKNRYDCYEKCFKNVAITAVENNPETLEDHASLDIQAGYIKSNYHFSFYLDARTDSIQTTLKDRIKTIYI